MKKQALLSLQALIVCSALFSFSTFRGGDSYTIHVNNKQLVQYYVASKEATPKISLDQNANDKLSVFYSECGKIGQSRKLTLKDQQDNVLKEWSFANVTGEHTAMICNSKEIFTANKNKVNSLKLYYSSREVSKERLLVTIDLGNTSAKR